MSESLFNAYWYRVRELRPALRGHIEIHRHEFRGERWYLLRDPVSGRHHRLTPAAHYVVAMMNGARNLQRIFDAASTRLGNQAPTQGEMINLLAQLHAADSVRCDVSPDAREVFQRFSTHLEEKRRTRFGNPLYLRFPLFDPDAWLERTLPLVQPLFSGWGLVAWLLVLMVGIAQAATHWRVVSGTRLEEILDPLQLVLLVAAYPFVKALHELGHAFATKAFGGEVHEIGIMFLVFAPTPYVDASAAWTFRQKSHRMLVGAVGIMVELFLASIALVVWLHTQPGVVHGVAWNVMVIGSVSTLLFNGNPLLRFDGYFVLADAIEIPNLANRAGAYLNYLFQHYVLGLPERRSVPTASDEKPWLVVYGVLSLTYRLFVTVGIAFFVASHFFVVGVLLAVWGVAMQTLVPAARGLNRLRQDPRVSRQAGRVAVGTAAVLLAAAVLAFLLPVPIRTHAEGVVWPPERSQVRAGGDGFVRVILARPGTHVERGQPLIEIDDPTLRARLRVLAARERELQVKYHQKRVESQLEAEILREQLETAQAELERERRRQRERTVGSPATGRFVVQDAQNLPGRFVKRGDVLGYVADFAAPTVRTVVSQADIARVRSRTLRVDVRMAERLGQAIPARLSREVPTATNQLPSMALGAAGGGRVALDARDAEGLTAAESFFQFDLDLPPDSSTGTIGGRAYVRFDHGSSALLPLAAEKLRRLFLGRLGV